MIEKYPVGANITIMNCFYQYSIKDDDGNRMPDYLVIVYKDNETGKKGHQIIKNPEYTFYIMKDQAPDYNQLFIEKDKVEPVTCKYSVLKKTIAEMTGNLDFYKYNIETKQTGENEKLHTVPSVFSSDTNIEDYYRKEFGKKYQNNITKLHKAFFDIEVDGRYSTDDFVAMGSCPINCIGFHDERNDIIHSFLLRNKDNPLIEQFENEYVSGVFGNEQIKEFIKENVGGYKQYIRYALDNTKINIQFFDTEIELLLEFFGTVHAYDPDFCMGWNSSGFDTEYIIARIRELGYEPSDIMCADNWEIRQVKNYVDQKNLSNFAERGDYTFISGNTIWIDQMIQYASRRKSKIGSFKSFKLDDIGAMVAKVKKLDYSHITNNIAMLPWLDYKTFVLYNIFDVIVQKCIEKKNNDMEYIFAKALVNNTSYKKVHRQTVYLINRMNKEFEKLGYIIGNNTNKWNEEPEKFLGALVADPKCMSDFSKMKIDGTPIMVTETDQDFDYKSLYPSIDLENNIAPNTQIGRIIINEKVYANENRYANEKYSRGGEFIENMVCDNIILFCHRWLHLANFQELLDDISEYYYMGHERWTNHDLSYRDYVVDNGKRLVSPFVHVDNQLINPFVECNGPIQPFIYMSSRPDLKEK